MTLKNDEKSEELTCRFKIDIRNLTNFDSGTSVSKIYTLIGFFWPKYIIFELKSTKELYFMTLESDVKFEEKLTCASKTKWGI